MTQRTSDKEIYRYVVLFENGQSTPFTTSCTSLKNIDIELQEEFGKEYSMIQDLFPWDGPFISLAT